MNPIKILVFRILLYLSSIWPWYQRLGWSDLRQHNWQLHNYFFVNKSWKCHAKWDNRITTLMISSTSYECVNHRKRSFAFYAAQLLLLKFKVFANLLIFVHLKQNGLWVCLSASHLYNFVYFSFTNTLSLSLS